MLQVDITSSSGEQQEWTEHAAGKEARGAADQEGQERVWW